MKARPSCTDFSRNGLRRSRQFLTLSNASIITGTKILRGIRIYTPYNTIHTYVIYTIRRDDSQNQREFDMRKYARKVLHALIIIWYRLTGPPRILQFGQELNARILRTFGAEVGQNNVLIYSPSILHGAQNGYGNLKIADNCILNGNNYLDLHAHITLEKGVSIGPGVTIMTHNGYNSNVFLEDRLSHTCGFKDVVIKKGANVKAKALIVMGVTIGEEAVVAGGAVVNLDVPSRHLVAGVPARIVTEII